MLGTISAALLEKIAASTVVADVFTTGAFLLGVGLAIYGVRVVVRIFRGSMSSDLELDHAYYARSDGLSQLRDWNFEDSAVPESDDDYQLDRY